MKKETSHPALIVLMLILIPPLAVWDGYVATILWGWFIMPTFSLPALSIPAAIGVSLVVSHMRARRRPSPDEGKEPNEAALQSLGFMIFGPAFVLGVGAIVNHFMP